MRYFITLSYDGEDFCGWQFQPNAVTVQECLERTLSTFLKEPVQVVGAGRTDSKVNAIGYVAHFDYDKVIDTPSFGYKLNAILPRGIVVHSVRAVEGDLHARFNASRREYTYFLHRTKDPFIASRSYYCPWGLDVEAMNEAAALLLGTHDFRCFEKAGSDNRTSLCTVTEAFWAPYTPDHVAVTGFAPAAPRPGEVIDAQSPESSVNQSLDRPVIPGGIPAVQSDYPAVPGERPVILSGAKDLSGSASAPLYLYFRIAADRFLRNMVRAIVGSLIEVGRGRRTVADFAALILPPDFDASPSASPTVSPDPDTSGSKASSPGQASCASSAPAEGTAPDRRRTAADGTPFRSLAGESVPGHALFLSRVDY